MNKQAKNRKPDLKEPVRTGRPSSYTPEIGNLICERMGEGKGLRQICDAEDMPSRPTVMRWVDTHDTFRDQYARAREAQYDWIAEEAIRIADDSSGDYFVEDRNGQSVVVPDHARVQRARLQVDTRKWILSKLAPRKYGDKVELLTASEPVQDSGKMTFGWQTSVRMIVYPMLRNDGTLIPRDTPEYDAAIEKAAQEARDRGLEHATVGIDLKRDEVAAPPAQLTYQPDPLPGDLSPEDWSLLSEVLSLIRRTIPSDDNSPPERIFSVIRQALLMHFRDVEIERPIAHPLRTRGPKFIDG